MGDEPLVGRPQKLVFLVDVADFGLVQVGSLGKNDHDAEAVWVHFLSLNAVARRVVERRLVNLHDGSSGNVESLDAVCAELSVLDGLKRSQKQNDVGRRNVDFASAVPFKAVELCVKAVAVADLNRHSAVSVCTKLLGHSKRLKARVARSVDYLVLGLFRRGIKLGKQFLYVVACQNFSVTLKRVSEHRFDFHSKSS